MYFRFAVLLFMLREDVHFQKKEEFIYELYEVHARVVELDDGAVVISYHL